MSDNIPPIPANEQERLNSLISFDIDYLNLHDTFKDLARLAAKIAGTEISLINLIDSFTQWSVSNHGIEMEQMPRTDSVCQYTITKDSYFEVPDLSQDPRFREKPFIHGTTQLKYYLGVPLTTTEGQHIGALCVVDSTVTSLTPDKIELLKIVANEIMNRLYALQTIDRLQQQLTASQEVQKKVSHDIRGPIAGIIGLTGLIYDQGQDNQMDEVLECMHLIQKSGKSILELTNELLDGDRPVNLGDALNLQILKHKLERLYLPQAKEKKIRLLISINEKNRDTLFLKNKLLQIAGSMITNAFTYTNENGSVEIDLDLSPEATYNLLKIKIKENSIIPGKEDQYQAGFSALKNTVESMQGQFVVYPQVGTGSITEITLPQYYIS
jgi:K+-sensing histidine kinase KdpD